MARGRHAKALGGSITVNPENLAQAVEDTLQKYFFGVMDETAVAISETAAETAADLKATSPSDKGSYAKNWVIYQTKRQKSNNEVSVANKQYQLTHLLEHGHIKVVHGKVLGFTAARPHIANAERKAISRLDKRIKEAAKG